MRIQVFESGSHGQGGRGAGASRVACWMLMFAAIIVPILAVAARAQDPESALSEIDWLQGPAKAEIGSMGEIDLPAGHVFASQKDMKKLMEIMQNPSSGSELGAIFPEDGSFFVLFEFSPIGYVQDDEKDKLDADAILSSIREGTKEANKERKKRGWSELEIVGWEQPPNYDETTQNLQWSIRGQSEGQFVINHNTRILGRKGVMQANLIADPEAMPTALPRFKALLGGYSFKTGSKYAEFRQGDQIAKYGLTALVAGGAGAIAVKSGLLGKLWKLLVLGAIALFGVIKRFFSTLFGRKGESPPTA